MKLKGVNPIEQHIEKMVLGVVLILLLAVLSMQFVQRPNDIDVGNRKVAPDQVYAVLKGQADQLQSQLTDISPVLPELKSVDLVERYNDAFENASGGSVRLSASLGEGVNIANTSGSTAYTAPEADTGPIAALEVPQTTKPIAASLWSTLDPYAVLVVPEFEQYVPATQPFDFPSVTVEAIFNGKDLESALVGIPRRFWSVTGLAILGFESEREQLMEDGSWGVAESIVTPPHTPRPTMALGEEAGLLDLTALVTKAAGVVDEVARPMFPPTIAGELWSPPSDRVVNGDESESSKISRLTRQLDRAKGELDRLKNPQQNTRTQRTTSRDPGGMRDPGRQNNQTNTNRNADRNKGRIERQEKKIKELEEELEKLGVDTGNVSNTRLARTSKKDIRSVLEEEAVELWAHDLGVEPGVTYRYRTRVVVNNPLFRKSSELDPDDAAQQALTKDPFARGDWSAWSDPIVVGAMEYFFVTGGELGTSFGSGGSKATIELYKMFYGHYRRSTLSVMPGDELATSVRMSGDLLFFDQAVIEADEAAKLVNELGDKKNKKRLELPDGITKLSNRIRIDLGVFVLDIYTGHGTMEIGLGQQAVPMQIVLRDAAGNVIVRSDLGDESSQAYALASSSASQATSTPLRAPGAPAISPAAELFESKGP